MFPTVYVVFRTQSTMPLLRIYTDREEAYTDAERFSGDGTEFTVAEYALTREVIT